MSKEGAANNPAALLRHEYTSGIVNLGCFLMWLLPCHISLAVAVTQHLLVFFLAPVSPDTPGAVCLSRCVVTRRRGGWCRSLRAASPTLTCASSLPGPQQTGTGRRSSTRWVGGWVGGWVMRRSIHCCQSSGIYLGMFGWLMSIWLADVNQQCSPPPTVLLDVHL
jgi:hypothetical protein